MVESKCLNFEIFQRKPKTLVWTVIAKGSGSPLGFVAWFAQWRNYCFFPDVNLVFDKTCLRDIATFCEYQSNEHRRNLKLTKEPSTLKSVPTKAAASSLQ